MKKCLKKMWTGTLVNFMAMEANKVFWTDIYTCKIQRNIYIILWTQIISMIHDFEDKIQNK